MGFFQKLFKKLTKKELPHKIIKSKSDINKYFDKDINLYRYSKFIEYVYKNDEWELIEGFHTIGVSDDTSFEEASSKSTSFLEDYDKYNKYTKIRTCFKGGSAATFAFEDGSLMTMHEKKTDCK
jgi:hypothetical protein